MEWWSGGFESQYSNTPLLQYSIVFARLASEILLSRLLQNISWQPVWRTI
jgi:hypothetical protein